MILVTFVKITKLSYHIKLQFISKSNKILLASQIMTHINLHFFKGKLEEK